MSENPNNPQPQFNQDPQFNQQAPQFSQQAPYGVPVQTPEQQAQAKKAKTLSIVSLVSGIVCLFAFGYILGAVAIVTGRLAMNNPELKNRGMAIAGTILGGRRHCFAGCSEDSCKVLGLKLPAVPS